MIRSHLKQLPQELAPLDFERDLRLTPAIQAYLHYYRLRFDHLAYRHLFGTFQSGVYTLAAHIFLPSSPRGTVFILHGYLDHAGLVRHLIEACVRQGWAVALYDLPGHGVSSGARFAIAEFAEYVSVFTDFLAVCQPHLPTPCHLVSHSTGGAMTLEYLRQPTQHPFERMVMLAPLVRHVNWYPAKMTYALGNLIGIQTVPRRYSKISSDPEFIAFLRNDPLYNANIPLQWIGALYAWERGIRQITPLTQEILILQGTEDTVVQAAYNIRFLQEKLTAATVQWVPSARHHLYNEHPDLRHALLHTIITYLLQG